MKSRKGLTALKEAKISVTCGKKKSPGVRKETDAVPSRIPRSCTEYQNTLPPRFLNQPYHEVECRG